MKIFDYLCKCKINLQTPIPEEILTSIPIPSTDSIHLHLVKSYCTDTEQHPKFDLKKLPFYTYLQHFNTNFIHVSILFFQ